MEVDLLEAGARIDAMEYKSALALLMPILRSERHEDLQMIAILEFAMIAAEWIHLENRGAALEAFQAEPGAMAILLRLVEGNTFLSRLRPMQLTTLTSAGD